MIAIIGSIFLFTTKGLNYGIDFTGGNVIEIDKGSDPDLEQVRNIMSDIGFGGATVQDIAPASDAESAHKYVRVGVPMQPEDAEVENSLAEKVIEATAEYYGSEFVITEKITSNATQVTYIVDLGRTPTDVDIRREVPVEGGPRPLLSESGINNLVLTKDGGNLVRVTIPKKTEGGANVQQVALGLTKISLKKELGEYQIRSQETVGSAVSGELRQKGMLSIALALLMVLAYIWFRFEWQFGLGAVIALFHDVILTIGVFSLTQIEFNLSIIAAILTIVGYSLNDTVIVYDRIRENLRKYKKMPLPDVLNLSINDTLSRTILTSMTTLLALTALYILGGEGLRGFSFAMIWGVFVGTYSSIFVASPLLLLLKLKRGVNTGNAEAAAA
jgi:preprotein translocase SecF subunit